MNDNQVTRTTYAPGTIVSQFIEDSRHLVGVVVPNTAAEFLDEYEKEWWRPEQTAGGEHERHILLVLGCFGYDRNRKSMFGHMQYKAPRYFPWYITGVIRVATPSNFAEELALLRFHRSLPKSKGLNSRNLRADAFIFKGAQQETLLMVEFVQDYLAGKKDEDMVKGHWGIGSEGRIFLEELKKLFPRNTA